jgi:hypothetical protein
MALREGALHLRLRFLCGSLLELKIVTEHLPRQDIEFLVTKRGVGAHSSVPLRELSLALGGGGGEAWEEWGEGTLDRESDKNEASAEDRERS